MVFRHIFLCITARWPTFSIHLYSGVEELAWKAWLLVVEWVLLVVMICKIQGQVLELFLDQKCALYGAQCEKTHFGKHFMSGTS